MEYFQESLFGRTSPEPTQATKVKISGPSSKRSAPSKKKPPMFLDLRQVNGILPVPSWEMDGASLGELSMLNTGECPSVARESTLSQILEANAPEKYYLSKKACEGILRRAERRGKELPTMLKEALEEVVIA
jgi:hypothetical protein